jgi:hypothetical protein
MGQDPYNVHDGITYNALTANQNAVLDFEVDVLALAKPQLLPELFRDRDLASL